MILINFKILYTHRRIEYFGKGDAQISGNWKPASAWML